MDYVEEQIYPGSVAVTRHCFCAIGRLYHFRHLFASGNSDNYVTLKKNLRPEYCLYTD